MCGLFIKLHNKKNKTPKLGFWGLKKEKKLLKA